MIVHSKGTTKVSVQANIFNVFDQDTVTQIAFAAYRDALVIPGFTHNPGARFSSREASTLWRSGARSAVHPAQCVSERTFDPSHGSDLFLAGIGS